LGQEGTAPHGNWRLKSRRRKPSQLNVIFAGYLCKKKGSQSVMTSGMQKQNKAGEGIKRHGKPLQTRETTALQLAAQMQNKQSSKEKLSRKAGRL